MIISLSIGAGGGGGGGGRKLFLMDYFSYSSVRTQNAFNIEANWRGGVGQDNDIHNANIPLPSLFTEKLVLLRVEVDGNA